MIGAILDMKLVVPSQHGNTVVRERLTSRLREGMARKLIVISTPPGFGKTTILSDWVRDQGLPAAWLSLDQGDNDRERFFSYLHASLARAIGSGLQRASPSQPPGPAPNSAESLLTWLSTQWPSSTAGSQTKFRALIVLDDYNAIENPDIHREISYLIKNLPDGIRVAVASRTEPPLQLPLLRTQNQVLELHEKDLRFSLRETESFFNEKNGLGLSKDHIASLDDRTEGWIAGLRLAALAMEGREDIDRFVRDFAGSNRYVLDYLADEVFNRQSENVQRFLLKTSILDRMTAELCDAVMGETGSQARLEAIERENLFIIVLDDRRRWYRYHHLFSDLLRSRLVQRLPGEEPNLHRTAALWYESDGQSFEAAAHAFAAKDYGLAAAVLDRASVTLAMSGEIGTLLSWLGMLPPEMRHSNPRIPMLYAWAHFMKADLGVVEAYVRAALSAMGRPEGTIDWKFDDEPAVNSLLAQACALRAFVAVSRGDAAQAVSIAREALPHISQDEKVGRSAVLDALGDGLRDMDDFRSARDSYSEALASLDAKETRIPGLALHMDLARIATKMGSFTDAERICREVIELAEGGTRPTFPLAQAYILLGDILRERDELDSAEAMLTLGIAQSGPAGFLRYLCVGYVAMARCEFARGDFAGMDRSLRRSNEAAASTKSDSLIAWCRQFQIRLEFAADRVPLDELGRWIGAHPLPALRQLPYPLEDEHLTMARVYLGQARAHGTSMDSSDILAMIEGLADKAQASGRNGSRIEICIVKARVLDLASRRVEAFATLDEALSLAGSEGFVRIFADEGKEILGMVQALAQGGKHIEAVARITAAARGKTDRSSGSRIAAAFSERELEVLRLIAVGMDNQEIANNLFISVSTVKSHITRLYNRLGVESRTQAIVRARELGLA